MKYPDTDEGVITGSGSGHRGMQPSAPLSGTVLPNLCPSVITGLVFQRGIRSSCIGRRIPAIYGNGTVKIQTQVFVLPPPQARQRVLATLLLTSDEASSVIPILKDDKVDNYQRTAVALPEPKMLQVLIRLISTHPEERTVQGKQTYMFAVFEDAIN
jgi:hypothetical protein